MEQYKGIGKGPVHRSVVEELPCCTSCGTFGYPGDRNCTNCGLPLDAHCPNCRGEILHREALYCALCGEPVRDLRHRANGQYR